MSYFEEAQQNWSTFWNFYLEETQIHMRHSGGWFLFHSWDCERMIALHISCNRKIGNRWITNPPYQLLSKARTSQYLPMVQPEGLMDRDEHCSWAGDFLSKHPRIWCLQVDVLRNQCRVVDFTVRNTDKKKTVLILIVSIVSCPNLCYKCMCCDHEDLLSWVSGCRDFSKDWSIIL